MADEAVPGGNFEVFPQYFTTYTAADQEYNRGRKKPKTATPRAAKSEMPACFIQTRNSM